MTGWQRKLTLAALWLIAAGILVGLGHAAAAQYNTLPVLQYRAHWMAASLASQSGPSEAVEAAQHKSYLYTRIIDAHTHIIKLATVLLLVAFVYPIITAPDKRKRTLAVILVTGICVFPLGVVAEIYTRGRSAQGVAALGAMMVILAFAGLVWGLLRSPAAGK
jgi:hypothetical protein